MKQSSAALWTGRVLTILSAAFMFFDGGVKIARPPSVVAQMTHSGIPAGAILPLGIAVVLFTLLYVVPSTSAFGAIMLTGYLGGAVATNLMAHLPFASMVLAPVYVAVVLWLGLYLRDERLRRLLSCGCNSLPR